MNKRWAVLGLYLLVILSVIVGLTQGPRAAGLRAGLPGAAVGVVRIEGAITGSDQGLFAIGASSDRVVGELRRASEDPSVRAVVIRMNTPGGSAAASDDIGQEIRRLREAGVPVVVSMGDVAASGGYWIASFADRIVASPATITGSIGVIFQHANLEELFDKLGIDTETITSGQFKDMGDPARPLTDDERAIIQGMVDDIFEQFVSVVEGGRGLDRDQVLAVADGRIFTGRQAKDLGLVDELGTFQDALDLAAQMAGLDAYEVRDLSQRSLLDILTRGPWGILDLRGLLRLLPPVPGL